MRIEKRFIQSPVIVNACQFTQLTIKECSDFAGRYFNSEQREGIGAVGYFLITENGRVMLSNTDWIIRDAPSRYRVISNDFFTTLYKEVE